jgi:hypothetical protein
VDRIPSRTNPDGAVLRLSGLRVKETNA